MKIKNASAGFIVGLILLGTTIISVSLISLSRTNEVKDIWLEFEQHRNVRLNALITLRSELGYGGMIHHFKNYILRQRKSDADKVISSIGSATLALEKYTYLQLTPAETKSLQIVKNSISAYNNALIKVFKLIGKNKTAEQIDDVVRIDDKLALESLKILENEIPIFTSKNITSQLFLLNKLRTTMGYGGFIHNYKNYILRADDTKLEQTKNDISSIKKLISLYKKKNINTQENQALQKITLVMRSYEDMLSLIKEMVNDSKSARMIDKNVIVNDQPAFDAFHDLQKNIIIKSNLNADSLFQSLNIIQLSGQTIFYITFLSFIVLTLLSGWVIFFEVIKPITKLTETMSQLSHNNLEVEILGTEKDTEIGDMARSVEFFKIKSIDKILVEQELKDSNIKLEKTVQERTKTLRENEAKLTSLVENAVDAIITINEHGIIQSFNTSAISMFGYKLSEVIGQNVKMLMPNPYKEEYDVYLSNYLNTGEKKIIGIGREVTALRKDGTTFPIELSVSEIDSEDDHQFFTGIIRDITDQKSKELALQESTIEAKRANHAKSEFLSSMSHELRTPMNAILGFGQLLQRSSDNLTELQSNNVDEILYAGEHLLELITDVLDLSKIESGKLNLEIGSILVKDVLRECINLINPLAKTNNIQLIDQINHRELHVSADFTRLKQVILNLLSNAIKYNSVNGSITLQSEVIENNRFRICISDTGTGISKEDIDKLFTPFERLNTVTNVEGTGIGLVISKHLIEKMDGTIGVESTSGEGSTFWLELNLEK